MNRRILIIGIALIAMLATLTSSFATVDNKLTADEQKAGWKLLFDGKTTDCWKATGKAESWVIENGTITTLAKGGGYLASTRTYGNFSLKCDFKNDKATNSGIFFRWANLKDPVQTGIELQVLDSPGKDQIGKNDCAAIYDCLGPIAQMCKPAGEWNHIQLTAKNNMIFVDLNGKRVIVMDLDKWTTPHMNPNGTKNKFATAFKDMPRVGYIGFQDHGHRVWFKNIKIKTM